MKDEEKTGLASVAEELDKAKEYVKMYEKAYNFNR